ncbi:hypothetical protein H1C71_004565 [Ictidomys tridecemlineatus]|uniref:uncharacterized protein LOC110597580 isoform X1 n=1 Tax=Ictidomys tridecemlineatus TaxID=43179 RepID=UPI000B5409CA|nr:uncharacterized protein LOC110597580 isoform X1 [Ictidomys tridecemlineatus]KAG3277784.1 hypothetical protein H1C71_004565 [Ictidomys tridecemlineatus]
MQRPHLQSWPGRKLTQKASEPSVLALQCLPAPQNTPQGLGSGLGQERETQKLLSLDPLQSQRQEDPMGQTEKTPQGQRGDTSQWGNREVSQSQREKTFQGQSGEAPQDENKEIPQRGNSPKCQRKEIGQGQEMKTLQSWEAPLSQAWEVTQGEAPVRARERESPGRWGKTTQRMQAKPEGRSHKAAEAVIKPGAARDGAWAPLLDPRSLARQQLTGPGGGMLAALSTEGCGQQATQGGGHRPAEQEVGEVKLPGALRELRGVPGGPKASKAAWPGPLGGEKAPASVSAAQQKMALQRLLELHGAARRRRRQEREQQRLRVLERLRIASHRHCRVHPLGLPSSPAQLPPQARRARGEGGGSLRTWPGEGRSAGGAGV